jgi:LPXTG-motif cell wall-anchored protein
MKRIFLLMVLVGSMALAGLTTGYAQEDELFDDKKDTISIDDMDPVFYEAEEESAKADSSTTTIVIVAGVVVILVGAYFLIKKKKK